MAISGTKHTEVNHVPAQDVHANHAELPQAQAKPAVRDFRSKDGFDAPAGVGLRALDEKTPAPKAYTVRNGDTLSSIATANHVSLQDMKDANPQLSHPYMLFPGQTLNLPPNAKPPEAAPVADTTNSGNTTPPGAATSPGNTNPGAATNPGNTAPVASTPVTAPPAAGDPPKVVEYTVKTGDNFSNIAGQFGTTVKAIQDANPGVDSKNLQIGQKLQIPIKPGQTVPTNSPNTVPKDATPAQVGQAVLAEGRRLADMKDGRGTTQYDGLCLTFVSKASQGVGINDPALSNAQNSKEVIKRLQDEGKGRLKAMPTPPEKLPPGAVVLWDTGTDGHAAIATGNYTNDKPPKPLYLTTQVTADGGITERTITSLATDGSGTATPPVGYFIPTNTP